MTNTNQQNHTINKESASLQNQLDRSNRLKITCPAAYHIGYEHLLAGISGGVTSTMILHPLDTLKTRLAVSNRKLSRLRPHYNGLLDAFSTIRRTEGLRGLYRGVSLNIFSAGCAWGSYFFFYDLIKVNFQDCDPTRQLGPARHMLAASEAGIITLILTNPIWVVKTRLCLQFGENLQQLSENKRYKNMTDALFKTYQYEGFKGLYKGFIPGLFGVSHGALQFMTYEEMKNAYNVYWNQSIDTSLNTVTYLSFAAASKLFAATATYPYQVMRTRMQDQFQDYKGFIDVFNQTWRYEGFKGFYKGLVPSLLRVTPATAITFVVYEKVSHSLIEAQHSSTASSIVQHHPTVRDSSPILTDVPVIRIHGPSS